MTKFIILILSLAISSRFNVVIGQSSDDSRCDCGWHFFEDNCYKAIIPADGNFGFDDGQACLTESAEKASAQSSEENEFIRVLVVNASRTDKPYFLLGSENEFHSYCLKMEDGVIDDTKRVSESECRKDHFNGVVCEKAATCAPEWSQLYGKCYKAVVPTDGGFGFDNGQEACKSHDAKVASVHSKEENDFIKDLAVQAAGEEKYYFYLGLRTEGVAWTEGKFGWSDGTPVDFGHPITNAQAYPWKGENPDWDEGNENCVQMYGPNMGVEGQDPGLWNDNPCEQEESFGVICAKTIKCSPGWEESNGKCKKLEDR